MLVPYIPKELLNLILEYDGRIKYRKGEYIHKKMETIQTIQLEEGQGFYFEFRFDICNESGLCYDYNFSYKNKFEICYYNFTNRINQIRTLL
jgi:hypothetical protein